MPPLTLLALSRAFLRQEIILDSFLWSSTINLNTLFGNNFFSSIANWPNSNKSRIDFHCLCTESSAFGSIEEWCCALSKRAVFSALSMCLAIQYRLSAVLLNMLPNNPCVLSSSTLGRVHNDRAFFKSNSCQTPGNDNWVWSMENKWS